MSHIGSMTLAPARLGFPRVLSIAAGGYAVLGGAITLAGWALNYPRLTDWTNGGISMFPNAAACAVMGGVALIVLSAHPWEQNRSSVRRKWLRWLARPAATLIALVGGLTLLQHLFGWNFGIDTLLFNRPWGQRAAMAPMRIGPPASTSYLILGSAMLLATCGNSARRLASALAVLPIAIASLSLIGYGFGADQLFGVARLTGIAWQTSTMIAALGVGLLAALPEHGLVAMLRCDDAGGLLARRLLVPMIAIPLVLGWARIHGQDAGLFDPAFGTAMRTLLEIILLFGLLWWTASGISRHASERKRAEEALRDADRRKDEFLATLAHELRNPLAPIRSAVELLRIRGPADSDLQRARQIIDRQAQHMTRLVDDLLDVSRITRGRLELRIERVELASVVQTAVETSRPLIDAKNHILTVALPPEPIYLKADLTRLAQVFSNVLNNAAKYMDSGGRIELAVSREGSDAVVSVRDHGIGLPQEMLDRVFDLFAQADQSLERSQGGLGIGLTLTKRLVEMHGGSTEARSDGPGTGSEFIVRLPVALDAFAAHRLVVDEPEVSAVPLATCRVLVVDDNRDAAASLAALLKLIGSETKIAHDGPQAIVLAESFQPDLLLLDIGLPGMNGYGVCRAIRAQPWGRHIAMIAVTGWGQEDDRRKSKEAGFDDHLVKPIDIAKLRQILATNAANRTATPAFAV